LAFEGGAALATGDINHLGGIGRTMGQWIAPGNYATEQQQDLGQWWHKGAKELDPRFRAMVEKVANSENPKETLAGMPAGFRDVYNSISERIGTELRFAPLADKWVQEAAKQRQYQGAWAMANPAALSPFSWAKHGIRHSLKDNALPVGGGFAGGAYAGADEENRHDADAREMWAGIGGIAGMSPRLLGNQIAKKVAKTGTKIGEKAVETALSTGSVADMVPPQWLREMPAVGRANTNPDFPEQLLPQMDEMTDANRARVIEATREAQSGVATAIPNYAQGGRLDTLPSPNAAMQGESGMKMLQEVLTDARKVEEGRLGGQYAAMREHPNWDGGTFDYDSFSDEVLDIVRKVEDKPAATAGELAQDPVINEMLGILKGAKQSRAGLSGDALTAANARIKAAGDTAYQKHLSTHGYVEGNPADINVANKNRVIKKQAEDARMAAEKAAEGKIGAGTSGSLASQRRKLAKMNLSGSYRELRKQIDAAIARQLEGVMGPDLWKQYSKNTDEYSDFGDTYGKSNSLVHRIINAKGDFADIIKDLVPSAGNHGKAIEHYRKIVPALEKARMFGGKPEAAQQFAARVVAEQMSAREAAKLYSQWDGVAGKMDNGKAFWEAIGNRAVRGFLGLAKGAGGNKGKGVAPVEGAAQQLAGMSAEQLAKLRTRAIKLNGGDVKAVDGVMQSAYVRAHMGDVLAAVKRGDTKSDNSALRISEALHRLLGTGDKAAAEKFDMLFPRGADGFSQRDLFQTMANVVDGGLVVRRGDSAAAPFRKTGLEKNANELATVVNTAIRPIYFPIAPHTVVAQLGARFVKILTSGARQQAIADALVRKVIAGDKKTKNLLRDIWSAAKGNHPSHPFIRRAYIGLIQGEDPEYADALRESMVKYNETNKDNKAESDDE
ncbi:MAG: hypothetical protein ACR2PR_03810, partial [Pseudohongiellaceae bacterium]